MTAKKFLAYARSHGRTIVLKDYYVSGEGLASGAKKLATSFLLVFPLRKKASEILWKG